MSDNALGAVRPRRPNPLAFPSDTNLRFALLIVTVVGVSLISYQL
jgi:hypothetical protein